MKHLALCLTSLVALAFSASAAPVLASAQEAPKAEAGEPKAPLSLSANHALMKCLSAVSAATDPAAMKIVRMSSRVLPASKDLPERVAVEIKVGFHAQTGSLAEEAFFDAEAALKSLAKRAPQEPFTYRGDVIPFVRQREFEGPLLSNDPTGGVHFGTLEIELPAAAVSFPTEAPQGDADEDPRREPAALDDSSMALYLRRIASGDRVKLRLQVGQRKIRGGQAKSWLATASRRDAKEKGVGRANMANFLYLIEAESRTVHVTSVEIDELLPNGNFGTFKVGVCAAD